MQREKCRTMEKLENDKELKLMIRSEMRGVDFIGFYNFDLLYNSMVYHSYMC